MTLGAALLALITGGMSGEQGSDPTEPSPSATATATRNADLKHVDVIELDAESLTLRDGDDTVVVASMRDSATTVDLLGRLLGTPARTQTAPGDGGRCLAVSTTYTWGGALRVAALAEPSALGNEVEVRLLRDDVRARAGQLVELTGPDGVQVGSDLQHRLTKADDADRESLGTADSPAWQLVLDEGWVDERQGAGTNGVSAITDDTRVTVIGSPMPVHASRTC